MVINDPEWNEINGSEAHAFRRTRTQAPRYLHLSAHLLVFSEQG